MIVLALDTTMQACSAAVLADGEVTGALEARARGHAEAIVPMIQDVMSQAGIGFSALHRIAVTTGPGTFTGSRIGVATARGLALAAGLPLVGETSLAVMAGQVRAEETGPDADYLAIAADARRGQVYLGLFDRAGGRHGALEALTPADALARLPGASVRVAGTGAKLVGAAAERAGRALVISHCDLQPDAAALAAMAPDIATGSDPVMPLYLRPPDAKPQAGKSLPWRS